MAIRGLLGKKIGTSQLFRDDGEAVSVTAVRTGPCTVIQVKTTAKDGYDAVQLGFDEVQRLRNKPREGHLRRSGKLFRHLREFEADDVSEIEVGLEVDVALFEPGDRVAVTGLSKGRGFAGGVKRHGFHGGPKTHGQSDRHRAPGSIGAGSTPGRVLKGHKMAGHMGDARITVQNLEVVRTDSDQNLLFVKGAVPGARDALLLIRKMGKREG
jgi:large subunit ribosomal protein L3